MYSPGITSHAVCGLTLRNVRSLTALMDSLSLVRDAMPACQQEKFVDASMNNMDCETTFAMLQSRLSHKMGVAGDLSASLKALNATMAVGAEAEFHTKGRVWFFFSPSLLYTLCVCAFVRFVSHSSLSSTKNGVWL